MHSLRSSSSSFQVIGTKATFVSGVFDLKLTVCMYLVSSGTRLEIAVEGLTPTTYHSHLQTQSPNINTNFNAFSLRPLRLPACNTSQLLL